MSAAASLNYYEKTVVAVGGSLAGGFATGVITSVRLQVCLLVGAVLATLFVYHALFQNPPRPPVSGKALAAMVVWHVFLVVLLVTAI